MGGWFDYVRRVLGWKSSVPVAPADPRVIHLKWSSPSHTLIWNTHSNSQSLYWTRKSHTLTWQETD